MELPYWHEGNSEFAHEREALEFVRRRLPHSDRWRAWSNIEFISPHGAIYEVDLLVIGPAGFFLVEIKSFPGTLLPNGQQWRLRRPNGAIAEMENPIILANKKAKVLSSILGRHKGFGGRTGVRVPFLQALVFLSNASLKCELPDPYRVGITGRDTGSPKAAGKPPQATPQKTTKLQLPGIVETLTAPGAAGVRETLIDWATVKAVDRAMTGAGIRPSNRGRKAGDWLLGELLDEGPGWQDFEGTRPKLQPRRVRIYLSGKATTKEEQDRLEREAHREFRLLEGLKNDSIADARELVSSDRGPALLFDRDPKEVRLDLWAGAKENLAALTLAQRIELVRQLTEALAHAHAQRVTHRTLTARTILVRPPTDGDDTPRLVIGHWQAGSQELATHLTRVTTTTSLGEDLAARLDETDQVYLAPETFTAEHPDPVALDIFSLGTLAYLLLTGQPPAPDVTARDAALETGGALSITGVIDAPSGLDELIQFATDRLPKNRAPSVKELSVFLDDALEELTAPTATDTGEDESPSLDPLAAHKGDILDDGWEVLRRLGQGSTAVALLCQQPGGRPEVLKVARDEDHADRLRDEATAFEQLGGHPALVTCHGLTRVGGRAALRLDPAGDVDDKQGMVLADRIRRTGSIGLDLLARFGFDLLDVVAHLESMGIAHRDIKPDNLGVKKRPGDGTLHLVLFDLSLTRTPNTNLTSGTLGYLDPFLGERPTRHWDQAAERYAAAATLYEMATGSRPRWGDGGTDPLHLPDQLPNIDQELFDPSVRDQLAGFFTKALHRDPTRRFDTAEEMRRAWDRAMSGASTATVTDDGETDPDALERLAADAADDSAVGHLGLSGSAVNALERFGITTVGELLGLDRVRWNTAEGVSKRVAKEVVDTLRRVRDVRAEADGEAVDDPAASIDKLVALLVPKPQTALAKKTERPLQLLLGLTTDRRLGEPTTPSEPTAPWPSRSQVQAAADLDRTGYDKLLDRARGRWQRQPALTRVREDLVGLLQRAGGVLPGDELAQALLTRRGSSATGNDRLMRARAVVRAAIEAEAGRAQKNRLAWRRLGGGSVVVALQNETLEAEELADYASDLGVVADQLAATDPLPDADTVAARLQAVVRPEGVPVLTPQRLVRLAAATSNRAAVSGRGELYPRDLPVERAIRLARPSLLSAGTLSEDEIRSRVRARFPAAEPLPQRPQLDRLLGDIGLQWFAGGAGTTGAPLPPGFRLPPPPQANLSTALGSTSTRLGTSLATPERRQDDIDFTDDRLSRHAQNGGFLVLTMRTPLQEPALARLARMGPTVIDVDRALIGAIRQVAPASLKWQTIVNADSTGSGGGKEWDRLLQLAERAMAVVEAQVLSAEHVLLTHPGLLARYGQIKRVDTWREATRMPVDGQALRTLWLAVPSRDPQRRPTIDQTAVPITTNAEHLALPEAWIKLAAPRLTPTEGAHP